MKIKKQLIKLKYDQDSELIRILGCVDNKPNEDDGCIYATIDDVIKLKSTGVLLESMDVPQIIKTTFSNQ